MSEFEILSAAEKSRLLSDFNPPRVFYDRDRTLWELFAESAERNPDKSGGAQLAGRSGSAIRGTCGSRASTSLGRNQAREVIEGKPTGSLGFPVALCVDRSAVMIAPGMLGIGVAVGRSLCTGPAVLPGSTHPPNASRFECRRGAGARTRNESAR